ncbi:MULTISPECIES: hypothetical protein [unclassified Streptomyces]|uniref:hypothetical protein n=1 Tax=unclassified Streptomyces TaxID=2593676 RepID=UPI0033A44CB5
MAVTYAGPGAEPREAVAPLLAPGPAATVVAEIPYADFQCVPDDPPGQRNHRPAEVKAAHDPGNVFRFDHDIAPAA